MGSSFRLTGLDGSSPLGFLAALGTLRLADRICPGHVRLRWVSEGRWLPVLEGPEGMTESEWLAGLHRLLHRQPDPAAEEIARQRATAYTALTREVKRAEKAVRDRQLRGQEREAALQAEVRPLEQQAEKARASWLEALGQSAPALFLTLGKTVSVTPEEYRAYAGRVREAAHAAPVVAHDPMSPAHREEADFAAAFGCEACVLRNGRIEATQLQLITGSGHQFFLETLGKLMADITLEKLRRALVGPWTYPDRSCSFRWDPIEDRRYAYGWSDPSGDDVRTEHGANLLAAMGLPLLPAVPTARGLITTGVSQGGDFPALTWSIWEGSLPPDVVRSLLGLSELTATVPNRDRLRPLGIVEVFRSLRIEVGRPPLSKLNLTPSVSV